MSIIMCVNNFEILSRSGLLPKKKAGRWENPAAGGVLNYFEIRPDQVLGMA